MLSHWLIERLAKWGERDALVHQNEPLSYASLCGLIDHWVSELQQSRIYPGQSLAICGDYSPQACALILAALGNRNIVVPLSSSPETQWDEMMEIAQVQHAVMVGRTGTYRKSTIERSLDHPLLCELQKREAPGLVLFSSGSTGRSKASLLDFDALLEKFRDVRPSYRTLVFLSLDHIGGVNTLFHVLCYGGTAITPDQRSPDAVCAAIEAHRVQLLPTTPTFIRMLLISDAIKRYDLSSLEIITYGTEPMPENTLTHARSALPSVRFKQTYGLSELGIMATQSRGSDSVWLKLGGQGFEHKIVDGVLWLKSASAMLGYLNAESPFDADGWFNTQDLVEVDGEYVRILGRKSEMINVGGEKVHPAEIENVLLAFDNINDATVYGRPNPVTGQVVAARITPIRPEDPDGLRRRLRSFCQSRLERFKIPTVIEIIDSAQHSARFKKIRQVAIES
jgi:acyl-CoA synthetase (AMP-forming)/AMP-acid ligase II